MVPAVPTLPIHRSIECPSKHKRNIKANFFFYCVTNLPNLKWVQISWIWAFFCTVFLIAILSIFIRAVSIFCNCIYSSVLGVIDMRFSRKNTLKYSLLHDVLDFFVLRQFCRKRQKSIISFFPIQRDACFSKILCFW